MKKYLIILMSVFTLGLAACAPEGMGDKFYSKATKVIDEIDDDTMEMELSDNDDLNNVRLLKNKARTQKEKKFMNYLEQMVQNQQAAINGDDNALNKYLDAREEAYEVLEQHTMDFEFTEED